MALPPSLRRIKNLRFLQHLPSRRLAILVLLTTDWRRIRQDADSVVQAVASLSSGDYVELPIRSLPKPEPRQEALLMHCGTHQDL